MALNPATAKICADAICAAISVTDPAAIATWESIVTQLYASLKTDILITLLTGTVVTTGSAVTQTGPVAPVLMNPA